MSIKTFMNSLQIDSLRWGDGLEAGNDPWAQFTYGQASSCSWSVRFGCLGGRSITRAHSRPVTRQHSTVHRESLSWHHSSPVVLETYWHASGARQSLLKAQRIWRIMPIWLLLLCLMWPLVLLSILLDNATSRYLKKKNSLLSFHQDLLQKCSNV